MTQWAFTPSQPGVARNIASWQVTQHNHEAYQIDVSWPLTWSSPMEDDSVANVIYLVDGNALFLTATETLRRRQSQSHRRQEPQPEPGTVVVAIGYPLTDSVFSLRRSYDLTPPCPDYTPPPGPDGVPKLDEAHGGADEFLSFIMDVVQPFIQRDVFPRVSFARTALFGHSYGGLFVLHTLFTRPSAFDVYLAASPSVWWNARYVLSEAERFCMCSGSADSNAASCPILHLSFGSREQAPVRGSGETLERFQVRQAAAEHRRMADNCRELQAMLLESAGDRLRVLEVREYLGEDHGSVVAPALSGAIALFSSVVRQ
ncbi:Alpha/Beta hydrolase protein [Aspergillus falconensis]